MLFAHVGSRGTPEGLGWDPHLDVLALAAALVLGYWLAVRRLAPKYAPVGRPAVERRQLWFFAGAVATLLAFSLWPLHDLAEGYLLSAHMVQHAGLTLLFPPLLLLGVPPWLLAWALRPGSLGRFLARSVPSLFIYWAVSLGSHLPWVSNRAITNGEFHLAVHVALVCSSLLMWRLVFAPLPGVPAIRSPWRWSYLIISQLPLAIPTAALTHATSILYQAYQPFPEIWGLSDLEDQHLAGWIMAGLELVILLGLVAAFMRSIPSEETEPAKPAATLSAGRRQLPGLPLAAYVPPDLPEHQRQGPPPAPSPN